jgi:Zn-dependent peptidase ImmA (M78 family)/transcriptional regulator with XRE-family HTH domain
MDLNERLRSARERSGLSLRQVSERTKIGESSISEFENGKRDPSLTYLQSLCACYRLTISHFLDELPISEPVVLWRSQPPCPQSNDIRARFLELCAQYHNLEIWCDDRLTQFLPKAAGNINQTGVNTEFLVNEVHKQLELGNRPGSTLRRILEEVCGVKIFHDKFQENFAACTVDPIRGAAVLLNRGATRAQRNFDLAHELFHLITWRLYRHEQPSQPEEVVVAPESEEEAANAFARGLLMPRDAVIEALNPYVNDQKRSVTFDDLFNVARQFDVDVEVLILRLADVFSIVDKQWAQNIITRYVDSAKERHAASIKEDKDSIPSRPERFRALAFKALRDGEISQGKFASYVGMTRREVMALVESELQQESDADEEVTLTPA